jgi:hypothetical protein
MALANIVSNQPASPITLAKRTAACPKAMTNRNGFMRIGTWPPKPSTGPMCRGVPSQEMLSVLFQVIFSRRTLEQALAVKDANPREFARNGWDDGIQL